MKKRLLKAALVAVLSVVTVNTQAQNPPITVAYQLTHSVNIDPTLSPDGKEFVYISIVAGKEQLFRAGIDGTNPSQLTQDDADHEDPAWSPDGKRIAFVWLKNGVGQINLMNGDGSGTEPLTPKE